MERLSELTATIRGQRPGHEFVKYAWLLAKHSKSGVGAISVLACATEAPRFDDSAPNVSRVFKSAVATGTTTDAGWASELSAYRGLTREWIDVVNRQTFFSRLQSVRAPFQTSTIVQTGVFSAAWVGEASPIPFSRATLGASTMLQQKKVGILVPFTEEVFASWSPAVEANVSDAITRSVVYAMELGALDPSVSATSACPASFTNGIAPTQTTGSSAAQVTADLKAMLQRLIDGGSNLARVLIVMSPSSALHLSQLLTTGGVNAFPSVSATGGSIWGIPVAVTTAAVQIGSPLTHIIAALDGAKILVADDGLVLADAARASALQFSDAPSGAANSVSLFQTHTRALRIVRHVNFERADDSAVAWFPVAY